MDAQEGILRAGPPRWGYIKPTEDGRFPAAIPDSLLQSPAQDLGDNGWFSASEELAKVSFYLCVKKWGAAVPPNPGL